MNNYENVVYVSLPYNENKNSNRATEIIQELQRQHPDWLILSPIHAFGTLYIDMDCFARTDMCLWLLDKADMMYIYGDFNKSRRCKEEINYCKTRQIPCYIMES